MNIKFLASFYSFFLLALFGCDNQSTSIQGKPQLNNNASNTSIDFDANAPAAIQISEPALVVGLVGTHCKSDETAYINAKMHKVIRSIDESIVYKLEPSDNVLSICVAKDDSSLSYRFGRIDDMGLEKLATAEAPFGSYYRQVGRVGESILFFSNGEYHYYIINSGGMGSGVTVNVFKNDTLITELFSGNDPYDDFVIATGLNLPKKLVRETQPFNKRMQ
ncbi:hypothetical protein I6F65_18210 [Pseudoalteromonas sp. SWXJZ94C]|uniref:hypothetical protein n=1 Tax=unclassified Pseudoalteromonas TaxID=194690 RepID=UPI000405CA50|nr:MULTISPECIES: hypothetical protein [unclassified Pseudoalteromonas]MBH0058879.1 hypothetical protein [Pseudoalteromonas sp. SWXJZ94C]